MVFLPLLFASEKCSSSIEEANVFGNESRRFPTPIDQASEWDELGFGGMEVEVEPPLSLTWWPPTFGFPNVFETNVITHSEISLKIVSLTFPRLGEGSPFGFSWGLVAWPDISTLLHQQQKQ